MSPSEAAQKIGCSPQHVRLLIRQKRLRARKVRAETNQHGYQYSVSEEEVERFKANPQTFGRPRKSPRTRRAKKPPKV